MDAKKPIHIFIGGGCDYYGDTAQRDREVCEHLGNWLSHYFIDENDSMEVTLHYGGQEGIPEHCLKKWRGKANAILSASHVADFMGRTKDQRATGRLAYQVVGASERERRENFACQYRYDCALFIQGGPYTTDEMMRLETLGVPVVSFVGSGGAAAGKVGFKENDDKEIFYTPDTCYQAQYPLVYSTDPNEDAWKVAAQLAQFVYDVVLRETDSMDTID